MVSRQRSAMSLLGTVGPQPNKEPMPMRKISRRNILSSLAELFCYTDRLKSQQAGRMILFNHY